MKPEDKIAHATLVIQRQAQELKALHNQILDNQVSISLLAVRDKQIATLLERDNKLSAQVRTLEAKIEVLEKTPPTPSRRRNKKPVTKSETEPTDDSQ